jgi:hypothetical protein
MQIAAGSVFIMLLLASCSGDVTRPEDPAMGATPSQGVQVPTEEMRIDMGSNGSISPGSGTSRWVSSTYGGIVTTGRFTIYFPPGCVPKNTFVTIKTVKIGGSMECELTPADLQLLSPATFFVDLRGPRATPSVPDTIFWFDSQWQVWVDLAASMRSRGQILEAEVAHLGRYKAALSARATN